MIDAELLGILLVMAVDTCLGRRFPQHGAGRRDLLDAVARGTCNSCGVHTAGPRWNRLGTLAQEHANLFTVLIRMTRLAIGRRVLDSILVERMMDR